MLLRVIPYPARNATCSAICAYEPGWASCRETIRAFCDESDTPGIIESALSIGEAAPSTSFSAPLAKEIFWQVIPLYRMERRWGGSARYPKYPGWLIIFIFSLKI